MTADLRVSKQELIKLSSQSFNGMINDINSLSTDENNNVDVRQNQWVILRQIIFPFIYRGLKIKCDLLNSLRNGLLYTFDAYFTVEAIKNGINDSNNIITKSNFGKVYLCIMNNKDDTINNPKFIFTKINTEIDILSYLKTKTSVDADYNTIINELKRAYKYLIQNAINDINETYAKCKVLIDAFENQQYEKFSVIIEKTFDASEINKDDMKCYDYLNFVNIDKIKNVFDISTNMKINDAVLNHSTKLFITNESSDTKQVINEIQYYNTNYITKLENIYNNEEFKKFTKDNLIFDSLLYTSFDNIIKKTKRDCYNTNFATTEDEIFELYNLLLTQFNITGDFRTFIIALHNIADTATIPNQKKLPEIVRDKTGKELDAKIISSLNILNTAVPAYQPMNVMPPTDSSTGGINTQQTTSQPPSSQRPPSTDKTSASASSGSRASVSVNSSANSSANGHRRRYIPHLNGDNSLFLQNLINNPSQTGGAIDDITSLSLSSSASLSESTTFDPASIKGGKAFLAKPPDFRLKATATHNSLNNRSDTSSINITNSKNILSQSLTNTTISGGELNNYFNKLIQTALKNNKLNGGDANTSIELNDDSDYSDSELDDELLGGRRKDDDDPEIIKLKEINHKIMDRIINFLKEMDPSLEGNELKENAQKYKAILNKHFRSEYSEFKEGVKPTSEEKRKYFEYLDEQITEKVLKKLYNKDEMDELSTSWKSAKSKKSENTSDSETLEKSEDTSDNESTTTKKKKSKKTDKSSSKSTSSKKSKKSGGSDELTSSDSSDSDTSNQFSETTSSVISSMLTGGRSKKHLNLFNY